MKRPTLRERFKYWFDSLMAHGTGALLGFLALVVVLVVAVDAVVVLLFKIKVADTEEEQGVREVIWQNLIRTLDANDVSPGATWAFRISMLLITVIGVFIAANLIGIVSGAFDAKVAELRKGRSTVLESGHTVILGWNSKIHSIVEGLCEANASVKHPSIVILAAKDKVAMEDEMRDRVPEPGRTRIICRSGNPLDQDDLLITNPYAAKSIIVLSDESGDDPDARAIKTTLALTRHPKRPEGVHLHIVGQIRHSKNLEVAHVVGGDEARWILATEKVGQITAQTSRQPGLSLVYVELLNFGGVEIYFSEQPSLIGKTFFDAQLAFATSAVMGIVSGGKVALNPPADTIYGKGDQLIVMAEDDSLVKLAPAGVPDTAAIAKVKHETARPEKTLILGTNSSLPHILRELDAYAAKGSTVTVVSEYPVVELGKYANLTITVKQGSASSRATLDALKPASFDHVIVVAYSDNLGVQEADTATLVTLLHLREIMTEKGVRINVVSEMLDDRNRRLAEVTRIDDFIVSDNLVSLMMSQVSENPMLSDVFGDLFDSQGCEIYLRPAERYVALGVEVDFYTVVASARAHGETAIGYLVAGAEGGRGQVMMNPLKTARRAYSASDRIIVLSVD
jgi:voltage-gated potassium channel Kch